MDNLEKDLYLHKVDPSNLIFYSVGFVVRDKDWDSDIVEIYPVEKLPTVGPDMNDEEIEADVKIVDHENDDIKTLKLQIDRSKTIRAKWFSFGQYNRLTPPDVRKGEQVLLWRYSNSDLFFWTTMFNDLSLRKEEVVRFVFSDKPKLDPDELLEDTYYLEINTRDKIIKFHTGDKWNEYTSYDFILNTKDGNLKVLDGKGNYIELDSPTDTLNISTNNAMTVKTTNLISINTKHHKTEASETIDTHTSTETKNVDNHYGLTAGSVTITGGGVELMDTLVDFLNKLISAQHIGNLGYETRWTDTSISMFQEIIDKINTIRGQ